MVVPKDFSQLFPQLLRKARSCAKHERRERRVVEAEKDRKQARQILARQARSNAEHTESILSRSPARPLARPAARTSRNPRQGEEQQASPQEFSKTAKRPRLTKSSRKRLRSAMAQDEARRAESAQLSASQCSRVTKRSKIVQGGDDRRAVSQTRKQSGEAVIEQMSDVRRWEAAAAQRIRRVFVPCP